MKTIAQHLEMMQRLLRGYGVHDDIRFLLLHHIASDGKTIDLRWPPISQHCARSKKTINISSATDQIL